MNQSFLILLFLLVLGCTQSATVTKEDEEAMVKATDLGGRIKGFVIDPAKESLVKNLEFNNGYQLVYTFQDAGLFIHHAVSVRKSESAALIDQKANGFATEIAFKKTEPIKRNDLFSWGDESTFSLMKRKRDGALMGNMLIARKGNLSVFLMFVGIFFDDPESIRGLLEPKLKAAERLPEP